MDISISCDALGNSDNTCRVPLNTALQDDTMKSGKEMAPHYSGDNSKEFWTRVNKVKPLYVSALLYELGCTLQNLEGLVLRELARYERQREHHDTGTSAGIPANNGTI